MRKRNQQISAHRVVAECGDALELQQIFAAIDIGSNSFHLIIAKWVGTHLQVLARARKTVRLASGLDANNNLRPSAIKRGLKCLAEFQAELEQYDIAKIRIVATNTLRVANNRQEFIDAAKTVIATPIEVIAGATEAKLIYFGIINGQQQLNDKILVLDIGGGSTEIIYGLGAEPKELSSLQMGCVVYKQQFFSRGKLKASAFAAAKTACEQLLQQEFANANYNDVNLVMGSAGTIQAVRDVAVKLGLGGPTITPELTQKLLNITQQYDNSSDLKLKGLKKDRRPVFPSGLIILDCVLKHFKVEELEVSDYALREGVLCQLLLDSVKN